MASPCTVLLKPMYDRVVLCGIGQISHAQVSGIIALNFPRQLGTMRDLIVNLTFRLIRLERHNFVSPDQSFVASRPILELPAETSKRWSANPDQFSMKHGAINGYVPRFGTNPRSSATGVDLLNNLGKLVENGRGVRLVDVVNVP